MSAPSEWVVDSTELVDPPDPAVVFERVFARRGQPFEQRDNRCVWLDSARTSYGLGRWSYLAVADPVPDLSWSAGTDGDPAAGADVLERLSTALGRHPVDPEAFPAPFVGGYVGYLGYGVKQLCGFGRAPDAQGCDAHLLRVSRFVAYDHVEGRAWAVAVGPPLTAARESARAWLRRCVRHVDEVRGVPRTVTTDDRDGAVLGQGRLATPEPTVDRSSYLRDLDEVQRWLHAGESYEACYTYRLRFPLAGDPLAAYLRLRAASPAPYGVYLRAGGRALLGASPERFLTVSASGWARTRPIKGTAPRHDDPADDAAAAASLPTDRKTRSESLMIVDLLRNDLGRVCAPGTVSVPSFMEVESYAAVHQLVSEVRGRLRPGLGAVDAVRALFPGGSMTGAPKERTVRMLDALEPDQRGVYSGAVGFFSATGAADLAIVIRTAVVDDGWATVGTGGAITVLSDAADEYAETALKAGPLLRVLGAAEPADWSAVSS